MIDFSVLEKFNLPWWVIALLFAAFLFWKMAGESTGVAKLLRPLSLRHRRNAVIVDLKKQLGYMSDRLDDLALQSQIRDEYIIYDQEWHRENDLSDAATGQSSAPHVAFVAFKRDWMANHGK